MHIENKPSFGAYIKTNKLLWDKVHILIDEPIYDRFINEYPAHAIELVDYKRNESKVRAKIFNHQTKRTLKFSVKKTFISFIDIMKESMKSKRFWIQK